MPYPLARYLPRLCPRVDPSDDAWAKSRERRAPAASLWQAILPTLPALSLLFAFSLSSSAIAQTSVEDFYRGRQVNLIVGYGPGGGYDTAARLLARYLPRFLPGNPTVVVQTLPGDGSMRATNWLSTRAPRAGWTTE